MLCYNVIIYNNYRMTLKLLKFYIHMYVLTHS